MEKYFLETPDEKQQIPLDLNKMTLEQKIQVFERNLKLIVQHAVRLDEVFGEEEIRDIEKARESRKKALKAVPIYIPEPEVNCPECPWYGENRQWCNQFGIPGAPYGRVGECLDAALDPSNILEIFDRIRIEARK